MALRWGNLRRRFEAAATGTVLKKSGGGEPVFEAGGEGGEPDPLAIHAGEPLTEIVGDDGGVAYEGPDGVPVLAFRVAGDAFDRVKVWAGDAGIRLGNGEIAPRAALTVQDDSGRPTLFIDDPGIGSEFGITIQTPHLKFACSEVLFGNSTLQFFGEEGAPQPGAIADATDAASTQARLNDVLAALRSLGIIAT